MRILVVEDNKKVAGFIKKGLKEENYAVDIAEDGDKGKLLAETNNYDIIILDIMLPKKDGLTVLKELREDNIITPTLILTAKNDIQDKIKGLDEGADDYLTKPFSFEELLARIRALFRRKEEYKAKSIKISDLELNPSSHKVSRGGKEIELTGKEYALLEYMVRNRGRILTDTIIMEHIWNLDFDPGTNVVKVYIHHLREKIDKDFEVKLIHTVRGLGYLLEDKN